MSTAVVSWSTLLCCAASVVRLAGTAWHVARVRDRAEVRARAPWRLVHTLAALEPPIMMVAVVYLLWRDPALAQGFTSAFGVSAPAWLSLLGIPLALSALALMLWTTRVTQVVVGHVVSADHTLALDGPYRYVRHPLYLSIILLWLGLSLGALNAYLLACTLGFVVPTYARYIRAEEALLCNVFGDTYRGYCASVPRLLPGRARRAGETSGA